MTRGGTITIAIVCCSLLLAMGCEEPRRRDSCVGNLNDYSYSNGRGKHYGPNAVGDLVGVDDFEGAFVWVDYAAPWCSPCTQQASVIRRIENAFGPDVYFLRVITSGAEPFEPATEQTAATWARRFGLNAHLVVSEGHSTRTIPQHALFSPLGQTLYREVGLHSEQQIRSALSDHIREWRLLHPES